MMVYGPSLWSGSHEHECLEADKADAIVAHAVLEPEQMQDSPNDQSKELAEVNHADKGRGCTTYFISPNLSSSKGWQHSSC